MWQAASEARLDWEARALGPGDELPRDRVAWIVEGYAQALTHGPTGPSHLAGRGPEVAFVPSESMAGALAGLYAASPLRAVLTSRESFEDFWRQRQALFETSTDKLYGMTLP